jgi:hypothetical protein
MLRRDLHSLQSKRKKDVNHFKRMSVGMAANHRNQQGKSQKHREIQVRLNSSLMATIQKRLFEDE